MNIEEGEIVDDEVDTSDVNKAADEATTDFEVYQPVYRRQPMARCDNIKPFCGENDADSVSSSGAMDSSDSDESGANETKRARVADRTASVSSQLAAVTNAAHKTRPRNYNVWANVLAEDELASQMGAGGSIKHETSVHVERDVESYHVPDAAALQRYHGETSGNGNGSGRKRKLDTARQNWHSAKRRAVKLASLSVSGELAAGCSVDESVLAAEMAHKLNEPKTEIIANVVRVIGAGKAVALYNQTRKIEKSGGMLVNDGSRRRTSGGVFLQLLRTDVEIDSVQVAAVFSEERVKQEAARKQRRRVKRRKKRSLQKKNNTNIASPSAVAGTATDTSSSCSSSADDDEEEEQESSTKLDSSAQQVEMSTD